MVRFDDNTLLSLSKSELIVIIHELVDKINLLETRILDLEEKLAGKGKTDNKKKTIPLWVKPNVKTKQKETRKLREQAYVRTKDVPTHHLFHSYDCCPDCGGTLGKPSVAYSRQIINIPVIQATITEHTIFKRYCFSCKKRHYPSIDLSQYVFGKHRVGINLMALITTIPLFTEFAISVT